MLVARNEAGEPIPAWEALRVEGYRCGECAESVILHQGVKVTAHYAHRPNSTCRLAVGESAKHRRMKRHLFEKFYRFNPQLEVLIIPDQRADLSFSNVVIECQASTLTISEWERRTRAYNRKGYAVLWVWHKDLLREHACYSDGYLSDSEYKVSTTVRHCHQMNYGSVYLYDESSRALVPTHFERVERPSDYGVYSRRLKTIRRLNQLCAVSDEDPRAKRGPQGHVLVHFAEQPWWKPRKFHYH